MEYVIEPFAVKENIVVKQPSQKYEYAFRLDITGLYPELTTEGVIKLFDVNTNELKYQIPSPYMYDSAGYISYDVSYNLVNLNEIYYLTVDANADWINDSERTFPVIIDPTYTSETERIVEDTYINGALPNTVFGGLPDLWIRSDRMSFIKTDTPAVPSGKYLHFATLRTYYYYNEGINTGYVDVTAHQITENWYETNHTWNLASDKPNYGMSTKALSKRRAEASAIATTANPEILDFDITEAVCAWENGVSNFGIGLRYADTSSNLSVIFKSSNTQTNYAPRLIYQYGDEFQFTMELQYDHGYKSRYSNPVTIINCAAAKAERVFADTYNVNLQYGPPKKIMSLADQCSLGDEFDFYYENACECVENEDCCSTDIENVDNLYDVALEEYHHKNIKNIIMHLESPATSLNAAVAFIGHATCKKSGNTHAINYDRGLAVQKFGLVAINNQHGDESEIVTLIHEMGHMLGIEDHYDNTLPGNDDCLYGDNGHTEDVVDDIIICQVCLNKVAAFVEKYKG